VGRSWSNEACVAGIASAVFVFIGLFGIKQVHVIVIAVFCFPADLIRIRRVVKIVATNLIPYPAIFC
jgi:hypothetical protein